MYHVALRLLKNPTDAEDAVQEAFIKAFKNLDCFSNEVSFGSWLKKIVIRVCLDMLKKPAYQALTIDIDNHKLEEKLEDSWDDLTEFTTKKIHQCIAKLPNGYHEVTHLYLLEGYDHEEISEILQISKVNSRTLLYRSKKLLQSQLIQLKNEVQH